MAAAQLKSIFSVDVEDWFHVLDLPSTPDISQWDSLPSHVEKNFMKLLDIFSEKNVSVTCFFLAYVAQKFPHLVQEAAKRGHEIASHGYSHRLVYSMTEAEFLDDVTKAKKIIEDAAGRPVLGYRAPGFSVTEETPWFFPALIKAGYRYDSSVFPAPRGHGGLKTDALAPHVMRNDPLRHPQPLVEFPITVARFAGRPMCFFGGGYLRLFPYALIARKSREVLRQERPVIFYIHPREIDPDHPRMPMSAQRRFKCYVNLKGTAGKIRRILDDFAVTTFAQYLAEHPTLTEA